jgi:hypothetical protein
MKKEVAFLVASPVILREIVRRPLVVTKRDVFLVESQAILPRIVLESQAALVVVDLAQEEIEVGIVQALPAHIVTSLVMALVIVTMAAVTSPLVIMVVLVMILAILPLLTTLLVTTFVTVQSPNQGEMIILTSLAEDLLPRIAILHLELVTMVRPLLMTTDEDRLPIPTVMLEAVGAVLLGLSVIPTAMVVMVVMVVIPATLSVAMAAIHRPDPVLVRDLDPLATHPTVLELVHPATDRLLVVAVLLVTKEDAVLRLPQLEARPAPEVPQEVGTGVPHEGILHRYLVRLPQCPDDSKHLSPCINVNEDKREATIWGGSSSVISQPASHQ